MAKYVVKLPVKRRVLVQSIPEKAFNIFSIYPRPPYHLFTVCKMNFAMCNASLRYDRFLWKPISIHNNIPDQN